MLSLERLAVEGRPQSIITGEILEIERARGRCVLGANPDPRPIFNEESLNNRKIVSSQSLFVKCVFGRVLKFGRFRAQGQIKTRKTIFGYHFDPLKNRMAFP